MCTIIHESQMIDVEGTKFRVLLGTSPEEVEIWRAERRKRWPTDANKARFVPCRSDRLELPHAALDQFLQ